jgi:hypothetical protein
MDAPFMTSDATIWHQEVLPSDGLKTLTELSAKPVILPFYLAGGTALALQWGHRTSVDLDFFSSEQFDKNTLLRTIALTNVTVISEERETLHLHINATKVSFLGYHYPVCYFHSTLMPGLRLPIPETLAL